MKQTEVSISEYRLPPTATIERQVLADAVSSPEAIGKMMTVINVYSFSDEGRARMWSAMVGSYSRGKVVDMVSMTTRFGDMFINEVLTSGVSGGTAREAVSHAYSLRDAAARRMAYISAVKLLQESIRPENTEGDLCALAESVSRKIQGETSDAMEKPLGMVMDEISAEIAQNAENTRNGVKNRIPTGFPTLDYFTFGGWKPADLVILAARPSVGKTAVMLQMAKAAASSGFPVCIFSIEMTNSELGKRMLFSTGYVQPADVASGLVDAANFDAARAQFKNMPIYINERSRNIDELVARISLNARSGRCRVAFIDYLSLIDSEDDRLPLHQVVGNITRTLKDTAKELGIPIVLLCQINRSAVLRGEIPQLIDLRDSGAIEQDADIVVMLNKNEENLDLWVRKNRQYKKDFCITVQPNDTYSKFKEISNNIGHPVPEEEPDLPI